MKIALPNSRRLLSNYHPTGIPIEARPIGPDPARIVLSAAHVVADPFTAGDPTGKAALDWDATMAFRRHLARLGLGIAEAMDTAQRGMGLDWAGALEPALNSPMRLCSTGPVPISSIPPMPRAWTM